MVDRKLTYDIQVHYLLKNYIEKLSTEGLDIDSRYIDFYGDVCPCCGRKMKVYGNEVRGVGSLSAFLVLEQKKAIIYDLCKNCAKKLSNSWGNQFDNSEVESRIFEKLPDLKRKDVKPNADEIKEEIEILKKIW